MHTSALPHLDLPIIERLKSSVSLITSSGGCPYLMYINSAVICSNHKHTFYRLNIRTSGAFVVVFRAFYQSPPCFTSLSPSTPSTFTFHACCFFPAVTITVFCFIHCLTSSFLTLFSFVTPSTLPNVSSPFPVVRSRTASVLSMCCRCIVFSRAFQCSEYLLVC